jgi:Arc/MetJ family transcription regulator
MCMKRMNVMVDEKLLEEAVRVAGERTYSATINRALGELVRVSKVRQGLKALGGGGWWEGNLEEMRRDRTLDFEENQQSVQVVRDAPVAVRRKTRKRRRGSR